MDNENLYIFDTDGSKKSFRDADIFERYYEKVYRYRSTTSNKQKYQQQSIINNKNDNNNINDKPESPKMCTNNDKFNYQCSSKIPPSAPSSTSEDKIYNNVNNISAYNNNNVSNIINNNNLSQKQDVMGYITSSPTIKNRYAVIIDYNANNNEYKVIDYDENEKYISSNILYKINPINSNNINMIHPAVQTLKYKQICAVMYGIETRKNKVINQKNQIINDLKSQLQDKMI